MKISLEGIDQRLFNASVDLAHKMIDKGYAHAWFSWIEWIGITALILIAAKRTQSSFLYVIGVLSAIIVFFVGLAGVEKLRDQFIPNLNSEKLITLIIAVLFSIFGMWVVMNVFFELLPASIA